jgi:hypothetical protein
MAQQASITVKKFDGATDVIYTAIQPASGGVPAEWRAPTLGTAPAHQPTLRIKSSKNRAGTVCRVEGVLVYPEIVTASDGTKSVANKAIISFSASMPQGMASVSLQEAAYQAGNLLASAHVKTQILEGFAAV